jgi:hypothetical protein
MQVIAFAREKRMFFDMENNIQIAGGTAEWADFASPGKTDASSIFHAGWNFGVNGALPQQAAFALALGTGISDHAA